MSVHVADQQPLLHGDDVDDVVDTTDAGNVHATDTTDPPAMPGLYVWFFTFAASISGLLLGYDTGVVSATLESIGSSLTGLPLTPLEKGIITASAALVSLVACPAASVLADARGRRSVLVAADALFAGGALLQAASRSVGVMVAGRAIVGAAVGAASFVGPLYITETAPAAHHGRLVTVNVLMLVLGQVVAYVVGWLLSEHGQPDTAWRWMVGLGAVPAVVQAVLLVGAPLPESPRWLVQAGRVAEARAVICSVQGTTRDDGNVRVDSIVDQIVAEVRVEAEAKRERQRRRLPAATTAKTGIGRLVSQFVDDDTWRALVGTRRNRRALAIACLLQGLQQLCGFNSLMYFSVTIFKLVGFDHPTLTALTVATTNFVFTVAALLLVDRIGRRRVLLWSLPVMALGLVTAAYGFSFLDIDVGGAGTGTPVETTPQGSASASAVLVLVSIMVYVGAYAIGLGNIPWMQGELFALDVRSLGSGLATATNWGSNFFIGLTFLPLMDALTPSVTFCLYAAVCLVGFGLVRACYPETSGLSLEAAARLLDDDDWGVGRR